MKQCTGTQNDPVSPLIPLLPLLVCQHAKIGECCSMQQVILLESLWLEMDIYGHVLKLCWLLLFTYNSVQVKYSSWGFFIRRQNILNKIFMLVLAWIASLNNIFENLEKLYFNDMVWEKLTRKHNVTHINIGLDFIGLTDI